ncbi:putative Rho-type GTPase-activating protein 2 [Ilyonectria robusta]
MSQLAHQSDQAAPTASASPSVAAAIASGSASTTTTSYVAISASASTHAISSEAAMEARADDLHHFHSHQDFMGQDSPTVGRITFSNSPFSPLGSLSPAPSPRSPRPAISSPLSTSKSLVYGPTSPSPRSAAFPLRPPPSPAISTDQAPTSKGRVQPKETAFYSDSSDSESPEPRSARQPYTGNSNDSRTVSDPVILKPFQGSFSTPRPAMAGPVAAAQADSHKVAPRNSSIDSAISAISAKSQGANGPQDVQNGATDIARLIKTAGSPEAVIQYLLKEKQSQSQQNSQLWRLVDKQRAMILGLNKDLERALQDKEKYRKKLKEVMAIPAISMAPGSKGRGQHAPLLPGMTIPRVDIERAKDSIIAPDSPILDSDSTKNSPIDVTMAPYPITPPADQPNPPPSAVSEILQPARTMPKPQDHALDKFDHEEDERIADQVRKEKAEQQLKEIPFNLSLPPSRSLPSEPPRMPPPKPPKGHLPTVAVLEATPQPDEGISQFPAPPPRKPPPAPLQLKQDRPVNIIPPPEEDESDSDYDDILEVDEIVHEKRGRRKTREEDDREREIIAFKEAAARSASKKNKSSQPGSPRDDAGAIPPPLMQDAGTASLAGMLSVQKPREITAPLMSPGLPASPRPFNLKAPITSPPLSPRNGAQFPSAPLSPRPPRQPIPLPPNTPLATPAVAATVQGSTSPRVQASSQIAGQGVADNPANRSSPTERTRVFKGLVTDEYPDLLLPPNALPSIEVKVASSRMKPSRASMLSLTQLEEDPVFTLAIISRADGGELWRVEKESASVAKLDQRLKQFASFTARPPERSLFNGHAPAKLDARRTILEQYMDEMLNTPFDTNTALEVCKYLSSNVLPPNSDDAVSLGDSGSEISGNKTGPDGRALRSGYLTKKGKNFGGWKARFFVLDGPHLKYYETPGGAHLGTIKLQNAQIGKQSQNNDNHSPTRAASGEELDNQYRHAFLILEPKKKDSTSHVKHVLCAESDRERDRWVQALLQWIDYRDPDDSEAPNRPGTAHDRQPSGPHERPGTAKSRKAGHKPSNHHQSDSDTLVGMRYDTTQAGDAPQLTPARPKTSGGLPDHHQGHGFEGLSATQASKLISAPKDPHVISDSTSWGTKMGLSIPTTEEKKQRKRSFFGFGPKTRSSSDGQDSLFGGSETGATPPQNGYHGPVRQAFGVPLAEAVRFCSPTDVNVPLPAVMYRCIQYLDAKDAILEEGIFRLSGSNLVIKQLRERFNTEGDINLVTDPQFYDIHAIAGLLKLYLRELPTTILTRDLHLEFLATTEITDRTEKMAALNELVQRLPQANGTLLKYLIGFLIKIINNSDINKMTVRNVGIVFSPTLNIPAPVFAMFLQNYEDIFGIDPEVYELPSPVSEPDLPSRFADAPPRFDIPARPSTSGSSSSHTYLRKDPARDLRSTPTPPLMGNSNAARASPPSGSRQGYEPTYVGQLNAGQNANGYGPQAGYDVHSLHPSARTNPGYDRPHYQSSHEESGSGGGGYDQPYTPNRRRESAIFMGGLVGPQHQGSKSRLREETRF